MAAATKPSDSRTGSATLPDYEKGVVTLEVSFTRQKLLVHHDVITKSSGFAHAALKVEWQQGRQGVIDMTEEKFDQVKTYIHWLYTRTDASITNEVPSNESLLLAELYVMGERLQDDAFKEAILEAFKAKHALKEPPVLAAVNLIYEGTMPAALARP